MDRDFVNAFSDTLTQENRDRRVTGGGVSRMLEADMDKAHEVERVSFSGDRMLLSVDGREYEIDITQCSGKLAKASPTQMENFTVSPRATESTGRTWTRTSPSTG